MHLCYDNDLLQYIDTYFIQQHYFIQYLNLSVNWTQFASVMLHEVTLMKMNFVH